MKIKNWEKFQHFKNRRPPWIKLHRDILEQRDIMLLSPCAFRLLVCLWLVASEDKELNGTLPSVEDIAFRLRTGVEEIKEQLQELKPFLDINHFIPISRRYQVGPPETETEAETETKEHSVEKSTETLRGEVVKEIQKAIGRTMNGKEYGKLSIVLSYSEHQIKTAISKMKRSNGHSISYLLEILKTTEDDKPQEIPDDVKEFMKGVAGYE